jgi:hypothetical protein
MITYVPSVTSVNSKHLFTTRQKKHYMEKFSFTFSARGVSTLSASGRLAFLLLNGWLENSGGGGGGRTLCLTKGTRLTATN